jgi:predicted nucleic acid-binding protein
MSSIVFDATALIHFSRAGRLRELQVSSTEEQAIPQANVARELEQGGPRRTGLDPAAEAWLKPAELSEMTELAAFASYKAELGGGVERNNGEAAVLAWISVNGGTAIIDETVARNIGQEDGLEVHGSLWLLSRSYNEGILDRATAEGARPPDGSSHSDHRVADVKQKLCGQGDVGHVRKVQLAAQTQTQVKFPRNGHHVNTRWWFPHPGESARPTRNAPLMSATTLAK